MGKRKGNLLFNFFYVQNACDYVLLQSKWGRKTVYYTVYYYVVYYLKGKA